MLEYVLLPVFAFAGLLESFTTGILFTLTMMRPSTANS